MHLDRLKEEELEAQKLMFGEDNSEENPTETLVAPEEEIVDLSEIETEPTKVIAEPIDEDGGSPEQKKQRVSWKNRYSTYKASTDVTIRDLRSEGADLRYRVAEVDEELMSLKRQLSDLNSNKKDIYAETFSTEDEEIIGTEAIDIIKKAMKANEGANSQELESIRAELASSRAERLRSLEQSKKNLRAKDLDDLKAKLDGVAEGWRDFDHDPAFIDYLDGVDVSSGRLRKDLYSVAVESGDVTNVASFYSCFKSTLPKSREEILASQITPTGNAGSPESFDKGNKQTYHMGDYLKFMDDLTKGRYKGREKEALIIEGRYDKAMYEGRMR